MTVTEGSSRRPTRRYDPYAQPPAGRPRQRKNTRSPPQDGPNASGENTASPVASGSNTPLMTAQSPPPGVQAEPGAQMPVSLPPHPPHYGMPAYYPGYPPHLYGAAPPPQPGVALAPYPPPPPGTSHGANSSSSTAPTSSHVPHPGALPPPALHYAPYPGYPPTTVAHPSSSSASNNLTTPTQVRVSDLSQAGLVPTSSQQPGSAPVAGPVPGQGGQVPYGHGPPHYHYPYYPPPHPAQFQPPHGYPPPGPVAYQWPYAAYSVPPLPPHPSAGQHPQPAPVHSGAASYTPQSTQPQQRGSVSGSTHAEDGDAEMEETENV